MNDTHRISVSVDIPVDLVGPLLAVRSSFKLEEAGVVEAALRYVLNLAASGSLAPAPTLLESIEAQAGLERELIDRIGRMSHVAERALLDHQAVVAVLKQKAVTELS